MTPEQSTNSHLLQKMQQLEAERDAMQKRVDGALDWLIYHKENSSTAIWNYAT